MPPEQLPWDRRYVLRHDRSGSDRRFTDGGGGRGGFCGGDHRWREHHHHPHPPLYQHHRNNPQQQRWYSDFRSSRPVPPGYGKQVGWGMHPDETGRGFVPFGSRYNCRNLPDDNFRPFGSRGTGAGRYFSSRETRGSFSQKDWTLPSWDPPVPSSGGSLGNQKFIESAQTCPSNSSKGNNSENTKTCHNNNSPLPPPDALSRQPQYTIEKKLCDEPAGSVQRSDEENAVSLLDWKLKWNRAGSSGLSHSSSFMSSVVKKMAEVHLKNMEPSASPASVRAGALYNDSCSRKKPRLGWGEGLAKYEKKKVECPEDVIMKHVLANSISTTETMQFTSVDESPKGADCAAPATPSSVTCSSSPGIEEEESMKAVNIAQDSVNVTLSPSIMPRAKCGEAPFSPENFNLVSIANVSSAINKMLQRDDSTSPETGYVQATLMNKLSAWKVHVLKALEVTESEIDLLETKLKSIVAEHRNYDPHPATSTLLPVSLWRAPCHYDSMVVHGRHGSADHRDNLACEQVVVDSPADDEDSTSDGEDEEKDDAYKFIVFHYLELASDGSVHVDYYHIYEAISASNKDSASRALEELNMLLPVQHLPIDVLAAESASFPASVIKHRFLMRKRSLVFQEMVLALKFKVFQHFWREGRVLSLSDIRRDFHKLDRCRIGHKKSLPSCGSRMPYSGGITRKVATSEAVELIDSLLRESAMMPCRSTLKMPAMILDKRIKMTKFLWNNGIVEDPCASERERSSVNPWTPGETESFIDKLSIFGKDFRKIASFLGRRTVADCVEFYYKNHKSESFRRAYKPPGVTKQPRTAYLVANRKKWMFVEESGFRCDNNEAVAADVLASICGSGEAKSSCDWTDKEKSFFVQAVSSYGKDFVMISQCLRTKSVEQCKVFFSKARKRLGLAGVESASTDHLLFDVPLKYQSCEKNQSDDML